MLILKQNRKPYAIICPHFFVWNLRLRVPSGTVSAKGTMRGGYLRATGANKLTNLVTFLKFPAAPHQNLEFQTRELPACVSNKNMNKFYVIKSQK